jgi:hypothetical protein
MLCPILCEIWINREIAGCEFRDARLGDIAADRSFAQLTVCHIVVNAPSSWQRVKRAAGLIFRNVSALRNLPSSFSL